MVINCIDSEWQFKGFETSNTVRGKKSDKIAEPPAPLKGELSSRHHN